MPDNNISGNRSYNSARRTFAEYQNSTTPVDKQNPRRDYITTEKSARNYTAEASKSSTIHPSKSLRTRKISAHSPDPKTAKKLGTDGDNNSHTLKDSVDFNPPKNRRDSYSSGASSRSHTSLKRPIERDDANAPYDSDDSINDIHVQHRPVNDDSDTSSISPEDLSSVIDPAETNENVDDSQKPSIFARIANAIKKNITLTNILIIGLPMTVAVIAAPFTGGASILVPIAGSIIITCFVYKVAISQLSHVAPEDLAIKEFAKINKTLYDIKKNAGLSTVVESESEPEKEAETLQDPNKLSTWQKAKQKIKSWGAIALGAAVAIAGITLTVITAGAALLIILIASFVFLVTGALIASRGASELYQQQADKKAFVDSQNIGIDDDKIVDGRDDPDKVKKWLDRTPEDQYKTDDLDVTISPRIQQKTPPTAYFESEDENLDKE